MSGEGARNEFECACGCGERMTDADLARGDHKPGHTPARHTIPVRGKFWALTWRLTDAMCRLDGQVALFDTREEARAMQDRLPVGSQAQVRVIPASIWLG